MRNFAKSKGTKMITYLLCHDSLTKNVIESVVDHIQCGRLGMKYIKPIMIEMGIRLVIRI